MTTLAAPTAACPPLRFGRWREPEGDRGPVLEWDLKRNCSLSPQQALVAVAALALLTLAVASAFWRLGATLVLPFAGLEVAALGAALWCYARHATDGERIVLRADQLSVEWRDGPQVRQARWVPGEVRVLDAPRAGGLIELVTRTPTAAIQVGRHVRPEARAGLAREVRAALRAWPASNQDPESKT